VVRSWVVIGISKHVDSINWVLTKRDRNDIIETGSISTFVRGVHNTLTLA